MLSATLLLTVGLEFAFVGDLVAPDAELCDDGSAAWSDDDLPNWSCERHGCSADEGLCWDYRIDHCFTETGEDSGICLLDVEECTNRFQCFDLWLYCPGEYHCDDPGIVGCRHGTCTTDENNPPPGPPDLRS